jgi:hypothetical protein
MSSDNARHSDALERLAAELRKAEVIAGCVSDSEEEPTLGMLAASGPRAADAPEEYTLLVEAIREGYLLHYGRPRLIDGADPDLRLLTGDYLYALGLERLTDRGDLAAVRELADLISLCAQVHAERGSDGLPLTDTLWLAAAVAVGGGTSDGHERAKEAVRQGDPEADASLLAAARGAAEDAGMGAALAAATDSIGLAGKDSSEGG